MKPLKEVPPVQVRPGQSRSRQTSSECCLSSGDRRVRSVHSKKAGREDSAPKSFIIAMPTPLRSRKAASRQPIMRGCSGVAGVASPGHAFKRTSREPRRASDLSRVRVRFGPTRNEPGPEGNEGVPREANRPSTRSTCRQGRPEVAGKGRRAVVCAHSTDEGGEPQGFRKERPRYPPEGRGKRVDVSTECHIHEAQNSRKHVQWNLVE